MSQEPENVQIEINEDQIFAQRVAKIDEIKKRGGNPFGQRFDGREEIAAARARFNPELPAETEKQPAVFAGRLMAVRLMGKSIFADLQDSSGKIQLYLGKNALGDEKFDFFKKLVDIGDIVGMSGYMFLTRMGELTLHVEDFQMLSKSLRPLPEKYHGLTNIEQRYRQRYLDLITNPESREVFRKRFAIIRGIRKFMESKGFMEVETPMLQPLAGGANANPFKTFYEAIQSPMFMRIAPELYLKRLLVGGFEKVFELNRNFRNEGVDRRHNPEFTMMEVYQAYGDCRSMMDLVEELVTTLAMEVNGSLQVTKTDGTVIDLTRPWRRVTYRELVEEKAGKDYFSLDFTGKVARARELGCDVNESTPEFEVTNEIYEKLIEQTLIQPTFVMRMPSVLVPLAKACADDPSVVDVFELEINGQEVAPGYSELNDPVEQRRRFAEQFERTRVEGESWDDKVDEDFLVALEHAMPPAGGMGIGIDRLVIMLTGVDSIRDVLLFPQLRGRK